MSTRKASVKETGDELSPAEWARFEAAAEEAAHEAPAEKAKDKEAALEKPPAPKPDGA